MDSDFPKCSFLASFSIEHCACSLVLVSLSVIEISPIILYLGIRVTYHRKFFQRCQMQLSGPRSTPDLTRVSNHTYSGTTGADCRIQLARKDVAKGGDERSEAFLLWLM